MKTFDVDSGKGCAYYLVRHGAALHAFEKRAVSIPKLSDLTENEVLIQVEASGLNFADVMARQGLYGEAPALPSILGYEVVGRIIGIGSNTDLSSINSGIAVGKRVLAFCRFGGYASHVVAKLPVIVPISEKISAAEATALATQGCTAYFAAEEMVRIQPGDQVLVQAAAGGVGSFLVQLAKRKGATVYGTASNEDKLKSLLSIGLDVPIQYTSEPFDVSVKRELAKRGKVGLDVVFDSLGGRSVNQGLKLLGPGGRMVCFGAAGMSGDRKNPFRILKTILGFGFLHPVSLMMQSKGLIGVNLLQLADSRPDILNRCLKSIVELWDQGQIKVLRAEGIPVQDIGQAHERLGSRSTVGKLALIWNP